MKKFVLSIALIGSANMALADATSTTAVVAPTGTATAISVPAATVGAKAKKWSAKAYSSYLLERTKASDGNTSKEMGDMYVQAARDIGKGQSLALRALWLRNQALSNRDGEVTFFDPYVIYSNSNYFGSTLRTNIPTGEWSRKIGRHEIRYDHGVDLAKFGKSTITWASAARRYMYTNDKAGQRSWRWENDIIYTYEVNPIVAPFFAAKYEANWYNSGAALPLSMIESKRADGENLRAEYMLEAGVGLNPTKNIFIEPSLSYSRDFRSEAALDLFNDKETAYELEVSISL